MNYIDIYKSLLSKIHSVRSKESSLLLLSSVLLILGIASITVFAVSIIEYIANGDEIFRAILAGLIFCSFIIPGVIFVAPALMRLIGIKNQPTEIDIAKRIGEHYPEVKDRLCNSIELVNELDRVVTSKDLALAAFEITAEIALKKDFEVIIDKRKPKRMLIGFITIAVCTQLSFSVFSNSLGASLYRIVNFSESFVPPAPFSLKIEQVKSSVMRGEKVRILVKASGKAPLEVKLNIKEFSQENYDSYVLKLDSANTYYYEIPATKNSIYYYASAEWLNTEVKSELCTLNVVDKPLVKNMNGIITAPSYTKLAPKRFDEQNADISTLRGSSVHISLNSNKELKSAELIFLKSKLANDSLNKSKVIDSNVVNFKIDGKKAEGGFSAVSNGQYYIRITSKDGVQNDNPIKYNVYVSSDQNPSIVLIEPYSDAQVGENAMLPMQVAIADDYGFSSLKLYYRLTESKYSNPTDKFSAIDVPMVYSELATEVPYLWNLERLGISPEDKYEFYFEVTDNDRISGPKSARTNILTVRLPSLEEVLKQTDQAQNKVEKDLEKVMKQAEDIKRESEELNRELLREKSNKQEMKWEQSKKAQDLAKKQQDLQNKVSEIQKSLQEVTEKLKENNLLSEETLQKYMELQKLLKEVNSPEIQKMQEKMRQAMEKLTPDQMQEAMKNFKMDEEKFKQSIERTMKMLKRIQNEQKIDALSKKTEELINKLDDVNKKMQNTNSSDQNKKDELAKQQDQLNNDLKDIAKDLNELEKSLKELGKDNPSEKMQEAKSELNEQETSEEMNSAKQNMKSGNFSQADKNQKQARQNLKKFQQSLQDMKNSMQNQLTKEAIKKMQKATQDMSQLSKKQEALKNQTQNLDPNSMQYKDVAGKQSDNMAAMSNVVSNMFELAQKTFAVTPEMAKNLGDALQEMQKSIQSLTDRNNQSAMKSQAQSMASMNKAISQMQQSVAQMQKTGSCSNPGGSGDPKDGQGGSPGGMMQKLQDLAAQQQAINQAMQQMGNSGGQGGQGTLSPEQQANMEKLSRQQGNAKKSLEELNKEQNQFTGGQKKPLGSLEKIAQEMQEVVNEMKQGNITPETRKKQDKILSRLLDASRSMTERDFDKKREARSGIDMFGKSPKEIDMSTQEGKAAGMKEFLRSIQQGYNKDYELLIKQYFEGIQK